MALSIVKIIRVTVSVLLALLVTKILVSSLQESIYAAAEGAIEDEEVKAILTSVPALVDYIGVLVSFLLAPILFLPVYLAVSLIMLIPGGIAKSIVKRRNINKQKENGAGSDGSKVKYKKNAPLSWLWGMLIGAATGIIISSAILMPFTNYITKADKYYDQLSASGLLSSEGETDEEVHAAIKSTASQPGVAVFGGISSPIFDSLTTYTAADNAQVSVFTDLEFVLDIIPDIEDLSDKMQGVSEDNLAALDLSPMKNIVNKLKKTGTLKTIVVQVLSTAGSNWLDGKDFMGLNMADTIPAEFTPYANIAFGRLADMTTDDVDGSLDIANEFVDAIGAFAKSIGEVQALAETDFSDVSNVSGQPIKNVSSILREHGNDLARNIIATLLSDAGAAWLNSEEFMGLNIKDQLPVGYKDSLDNTLTMLSETDKDKVCDDLNTFGDAIDSIKKTYIYVQALVTAETTMDQLQENLADVLTSITPESVELVSGAINEQMFTDLGMSDETSAVISDTINNILSDVSELTDEEKVAEAAALNDIITYVSSSSTTTAEPEALVESVLNSSIVGNEILRLEEQEQNFEVSAEEKLQIDAAITAYELENGSELSAKDQEVLDALKNLFAIKPVE